MPIALPLILLPIIAIASFWIGYQLLNKDSADNNNQNDSSQIEVDNSTPPRQIGESNPASQEKEEKNKEDKQKDGDQNPISENSETLTPESETIEPTLPVGENPPREKTPPTPVENPRVESPIGLTSRDLNQKWGQPDLKYLTSNDRVTVVVYNQPLPKVEQIKYSITNANQQIGQVELVIANNSSVQQVINNINTAVSVNISAETRNAIAEVVDGKTDLRSFYVDKYRGMAQRRGNRLEIRIWQ